MDSNKQIPHSGELQISSNKKHNEVVVLVHHFGGSKLLLRRHVELLNQLGYDVCTFNLSYSSFNFQLPISKSKKIGARYTWEDNLHNVLDHIEGNKILFSFSFPSISVAKVISERPAGEIRAWVCEGGPFLTAKRNYNNYFRYIHNIKAKWLNSALTWLAIGFLGAQDFKKKAAEIIKRFPKNIPVLSIRSEKDRLVPESTIDLLFNQASHIQIKTVSFVDSDHLQALKLHPDQYKINIEDFLREVSTTVKTNV